MNTDTAEGFMAEYSEQHSHCRGEPGGRLEPLGTWMQGRHREGFSYQEAEQLCLRMYYRFEGIPFALRRQLSRATLAATFAELVRNGWIHAAGSATADAAMRPEHWLNLLRPNYQGDGPKINSAIGEAAFQRLRSGLA